jgi:hypothetical protein
VPLLLHHRRQAVHPLAEVDRLGGDQDPQRAWRDDHDVALSARTIAATVALSAPRNTRTLMPLASISIIVTDPIVFGRPDRAALVGRAGGLASAGCASRGASATAAKAGATAVRRARDAR